jgi:hypothetical protein
MLTIKLSLESGLLLLALMLLSGAALAQPPLPADYDEDGQVDRAEWREGAAARFRFADRNSDGYLDAAEQKQFGPRRFVLRLDGPGGGAPTGQAIPQDRLRPIPGLVRAQGTPPPAPRDTNGDGLLDLSEVQAQADEAFTRMDADGNGVLQADELMPPPPAF